MQSPFYRTNFALILVSVASGAIGFLLTAVGIGTANWQTIEGRTTDGRAFVNSTANFFYACTFNTNGEVINCGQRSRNMTIEQYYPIRGASESPPDWNRHLNAAAGLCIIGIILVFSGTVATTLMLTGQSLPWIHLVAPTMLFSACLFMLAGLAEGSRVLQYNGFSANLYQTGHLLTIFSFLCSAFAGGRLFHTAASADGFESLKNVSR